MEDRFDEKFAKITESGRGYFVISDITGKKFEAHIDDNGKVISFGQLDSIKDFIKSEIRLAEQSLVGRVREEAGKLILPVQEHVYNVGVEGNNKAIHNLLSLPILSTTTPDGDKQ